MSFDPSGLPVHDANAEIAIRAESEFESTISTCDCFVVQNRGDRRDYGTDFQIEAKASGRMTNFRSHVQVKGTGKNANADGSVSVPVPPSNLLYLLSQPHSIYVCFHVPSNRILVRAAQDVFQKREHDDAGWRTKTEIAIRYSLAFDDEYQQRLHQRVISSAGATQADRQMWLAQPPNELEAAVATNVPSITVPESPEDAWKTLEQLYSTGHDAIISKAFGQFAAAFGSDDPRLTYLYLSEINLAMHRLPFDRSRVREGVKRLRQMEDGESPEIIYCIANGHLALGASEEAKEGYRTAIKLAGSEKAMPVPQCWKNLGSVLEEEGEIDESCSCYKNAVAADPRLVEAHFALGMLHRRTDDYEKALEHFDAVLWSGSNSDAVCAVRGHRLETLFLLGKTDKAFDEILTLVPSATKAPWVLPWCARLVFNYARTELSSVSKAIKFWDIYLSKYPNANLARRERLLCLAFAKMHDQEVTVSLSEYQNQIESYLEECDEDAAYM